MKISECKSEVVNSYNCVSDAIMAWYSEVWSWERGYFRSSFDKEFENEYWQQAGICLDSREPERYFIITHKMCVDYRKRKGHFVRSPYLRELEKEIRLDKKELSTTDKRCVAMPGSV